jgi:hypothetical protein
MLACQAPSQPAAEKADEGKPAAAADAAAKAEDAQPAPQPSPTPEPAPIVAPDAEELSAVAPEPEPAPAAAPWELELYAKLPASTVALLLLPDPLACADSFGREALMQRFASQVEALSAEMVEELGVNLLTPEGLAQLGIDAHGPAGIAFLEASKESGVLFATLSDETTFLAMLDKKLSEKATASKSTIGSNGTLWTRSDRDGGFLIQGGHVFLHASKKPLEAGAEAAAPLRAIAMLAVENSLSREPQFGKSMQNLDAGKLFRGFLRPAPLLAVQSDEPGYAQRRLEEVKASGEASEVEFWTKLAEEEAQEKARKDKFQEWLLQPIQAVAMGVDEGAAGSLVAEFELVAQNSVIQTSLRDSEQVDLIFKAQNQAPIGALAFSTSPKALLDGLDAILVADGKSLDELSAPVEAFTGQPLRAFVSEALSGDFGFALTGEVDLKAERPELGLGFDLIIGSPEPSKLGALLEKLSAVPELSPLLTKKDDAWVVAIPNWKEVHLSLSSSALLVSTDPGFAQRLEQEGTFLASQAELSAQLQTPHAFVFGLDLGVIASVFMMRQSGLSEMPSAYGFPDSNKEAQNLLRAYEDLNRRIFEKEDELAQARDAKLFESMSLSGSSYVVTRCREDGIELSALQLSRAKNLAELTLGLVEGIAQNEASSEPDAALQALYDERSLLQSQLDAELDKTGSAVQETPEEPQIDKPKDKTPRRPGRLKRTPNAAQPGDAKIDKKRPR